MTRNDIAAALVVAAIMVIGDEPWRIGLAAGLIVAALVVQGWDKKRRRR